MRTVIAAHAVDLGTFLLAAPLLVNYELGLIGTMYIIGGPLLALAYKSALLSFAVSMARISGRRWLLSVFALVGVIGAAANTWAIWQVRNLFT